MKKFLTLLLTVALTATLAITGTIAYLTDTDQDVNTMVMGNVQIDQHEYQRELNANGTYKTDTIDGRESYVLQDFVQDKPLLPAIIPNGGTVGGVKWDYDTIPVRMSQVDSHGGAQVFNTPNAQDKFVTVENTGKTDAYVRTIVALEVGTATLNDANYPYQPLIGKEMRATTVAENTNPATLGKQPWTYGYSDYVTIKGNKYLVMELVYTGAMTSNGWKHENGVLPAGETTYPSLCQVYMASRATNEDVEALDGNGNGTYDILVLSQAVQVDGFADAKQAFETSFGAATPDKVAKWFSGTAIPGALEIVDTPILNKQPAPYEGDLYVEGTNAVSYKDLKLVGNAYISIDANNPVAMENVTADVNGSVIVMNNHQPAIYISGGNFKIDEGEYLIDASAITGGVGQIFLNNVKVNGEFLTQDSAAKYLKNVYWYGAYQLS